MVTPPNGEGPVAVAMSGGIDSSVACLLLRRQYGDVFGVTMVLHEDHWPCAEMAASICETIGVAHRVLDLTATFSRAVASKHVAAYEAGLTPNPCVWCNLDLKFGRLMEQAMKWGAERFATGHYACIGPARRNGRRVLQRPQPGAPDETYFQE